MPHLAQNALSRFRPLPIQRHNQGRSVPFRGNEWGHLNVQTPQSTYHSGGPYSPGRRKDIEWGN